MELNEADKEGIEKLWDAINSLKETIDKTEKNLVVVASEVAGHLSKEPRCIYADKADGKVYSAIPEGKNPADFVTFKEQK